MLGEAKISEVPLMPFPVVLKKLMPSILLCVIISLANGHLSLSVFCFPKHTFL